MAKKNYTPEKFPIPFPTGSSLPPDQADYLKGVYDNAAANYGLRSYGEAHPFKAALSGFLSGGLPGAINARATSDAYRRQAQEKDITGFTDAYKQALANQKELDAINILGNDSQDTQAIVDKGMQLGLVNNALPSIYGQSLPGMNGEQATTQRRVHSKEFLDAYRNGAFGGSDLNYYQDAARQNVQNFRDIGQSTTPVITTGKGNGVLRGGVNQNVDATQNVAPPFFISDPKSIMQNLQQIQSAGLAQGTEKYKFDQQAPVRESQIAQNNAQALSATQLAALRKIQAALEPQKVSAQANRDNSAAWRSRNAYLGGPQPQQPTESTLFWNNATPEQRKVWLANKSLVRNPVTGAIQTITETTGDDGKVKRTVSTKTRGGAASSSASSPARGRDYGYGSVIFE